MTIKAHFEQGVMVNFIDLTVYADGIKLTFGDSSDGSERHADHRGSFFLTQGTASKLYNMLEQLFPSPMSTPNANEVPGAQIGQEADYTAGPIDPIEGRLHTP